MGYIWIKPNKSGGRPAPMRHVDPGKVDPVKLPASSPIKRRLPGGYQGGHKFMPAMCRSCAYNYRHGLKDAIGHITGEIAVYDVDMVIESAGRIVGVGEWKTYRAEYPQFELFAFQYIALKKIAKGLRCGCFLVVHIPGDPDDPSHENLDVEEERPDNSVYYIFPIDRFEKYGARPMKDVNGRKKVVFHNYEGMRLTKDGLAGWFESLVNPESVSSDDNEQRF